MSGSRSIVTAPVNLSTCRSRQMNQRAGAAEQGKVTRPPTDHGGVFPERPSPLPGQAGSEYVHRSGLRLRLVGDAAKLGFVDVPAHGAFVHNILAGAGRHRFVVIVVAANNGPVP
jgi:hypothetical protein